MSDKRRHRGPHPRDRDLFAPGHHAALQAAVGDLCWLLSRGYASKSALKIVGDRHQLTARQRQAVARCSSSDDAANRRTRSQVGADALREKTIVIDGFNVLTTLETALSGGVILPGREGCFRDITGMHGNYRVLEETRPALEIIQRELGALGVHRAAWYFDQSVSNSGRIKAILEEITREIEPIATRNGRGDTQDGSSVTLVPDPDPILAASEHIIATSDSDILDHCDRWFNLARHLVTLHVPGANIIPMQAGSNR